MHGLAATSARRRSGPAGRQCGYPGARGPGRPALDCVARCVDVKVPGDLSGRAFRPNHSLAIDDRTSMHGLAATSARRRGTGGNGSGTGSGGTAAMAAPAVVVGTAAPAGMAGGIGAPAAMAATPSPECPREPVVLAAPAPRRQGWHRRQRQWHRLGRHGGDGGTGGGGGNGGTGWNGEQVWLGKAHVCICNIFNGNQAGKLFFLISNAESREYCPA